MSTQPRRTERARRAVCAVANRACVVAPPEGCDHVLVGDIPAAILDVVIVDVHCHYGLTARRADGGADRFTFEPAGSTAQAGLDSYVSPRALRGPLFRFLALRLGIESGLGSGSAFDEQLERAYATHMMQCSSVDALVLLAFDEVHDDDGVALGPTAVSGRPGSDTYSSNTFVHRHCQGHPDRFLFGASIHPYRRNAVDALHEVADAGAVLIKWLPVNQNIDPADPRTMAFLGAAAELHMPILVHYGGELVLTSHRPDQMDPRPMLDALRILKRAGAMPPVIVAHCATPTFPWEPGRYFHPLTRAMMGEFRDAPLYGDLSAMTNRPYWLWKLARDRRWRGLQGKLVFGSDFPIPPLWIPFVWPLRHDWGRLRNEPSWIERSLLITRSLGFDEQVFHRAGRVLRHRLPPALRDRTD